MEALRVGPFGSAQGRLFDSVSVAHRLRMTNQVVQKPLSALSAAREVSCDGCLQPANDKIT
jgi:hypothetical protein